jgi:hypothetical protein
MTAGEARTEVGMAKMAMTLLARPLLDVISELLTDKLQLGQSGLPRFAFQTVLVAGVVLARDVRPARPTAGHGLASPLIASAVLLVAWSLNICRSQPTLRSSFSSRCCSWCFRTGLLGEDGLTADCRGLAWVRPRSTGASSPPGGIGLGRNFAAGLRRLLCHPRGADEVHGRRAKPRSYPVLDRRPAGSPACTGDDDGIVDWWRCLARHSRPQRRRWMVFAAVGAMSAAIYLAVATALSLANTSVLAPLQYLEIIGTTLLGFAVFGTSPDATTWLATLVIVATGFTPFVATDRCRG